MSYFKILFDGNKYVSRNTFEQLLGYGWVEMSRRSVVMFDTVIYGTLTEQEEAIVDSFAQSFHDKVQIQDIDEKLRGFRLNPPHEKEFEIWKIAYDTKTYQLPNVGAGGISTDGMRFVKMVDIKNTGRYSKQHRMPVLYVGGKGLYVALDTKLRTAEKPIIITFA